MKLFIEASSMMALRREPADEDVPDVKPRSWQFERHEYQQLSRTQAKVKTFEAPKQSPIYRTIMGVASLYSPQMLRSIDDQ
jgi:hypothetical protein